jgi:serine/threonine protein phosphatase PrpC
MHLVREQGEGYAAVSYRGIGYVDSEGHPKNNEDRFLAMNFPDGRQVRVVIDGAGGHAGGERAAEIARVVMQQALSAGESVEEAIDLAHRAVVQDNQRQNLRHQAPFAVLVAAELIPNPDGTYRGRFFSLGDSEAVVLRPRPDRSGPPQVVHWTLQPSPMVQAHRAGQGLPMIPTQPDGRISRGHTLMHHIAEGANVPNNGLGGDGRSLNGRPHLTEMTLQPGDQLFLASDGGTESLSSYDVIAHLPFQSGASTEAQTRDVLLLETLQCMSLARQAIEEGQIIELTHERYVAAYQEATGEQPPESFRGTFEGHFLDYELHVRNLRGQVVGNFKPDNVTMIVQTVGRQPNVCEAPPPPPAPAPSPASSESSTRVVTRSVVVVGTSESQTSSSAAGPQTSTPTGVDPSETQVITIALRDRIEYFLNLKNEFVQAPWVEEALNSTPTLYAVFALQERAPGSTSSQPRIERSIPELPDACPSTDSLEPNQVVLEITRGEDGPRVRLVGFNRGNLSDDTVTALLARFPAADDITQRFQPAERQAVQQEVRVMTLIDLLEPVLSANIGRRVVIPIYWTQENGFSLNPPSDRSMQPLGTLFREPSGEHYRLRYAWEPTPAGTPAEIPSIVTQALQRIQQRPSRRRP